MLRPDIERQGFELWRGALSSETVADLIGALEERAVVCEASAGDILAFRPLLLHMSRKSARPSHRRVIQIEYAASPLPLPLSWYGQPDG